MVLLRGLGTQEPPKIGRDGSFSLGVVPAGKHSLVVQVYGADAAVRDILVRANETVDLGEIDVKVTP